MVLVHRHAPRDQCEDVRGQERLQGVRKTGFKKVESGVVDV